MPYRGFPLAGIGFLRELANNNNRQWFNAHRTEYEALVHNPSLELVTALGEELAAAFPPITCNTTGNDGSLMRLYRDTRFSADKTPFKTNIAIMSVPAGLPKMGAPGFGIQMEQHFSAMSPIWSWLIECVN